MSLLGLDPSDPRVRYAREFVYGAGPSGGITDDRPVVLSGNLTSAGTATANEITDPVATAAQARTWAGARSELNAMYRRFVQVAQDVELRLLPVAESSGTAATRVLTVDSTSDSVNGWRFKLDGQTFEYTPADGDDDETTATGIAAVFNSRDSGQLLCSAAAADNTTDWQVTLTYAHKGTRGAHYLGQLQVESLGANGQTVTAGAVSAGSTEDDHTTAIAALAAYDGAYYVITAKTATTAPSATDDGLGELQASMRTQGEPSGGKEQRLFFGLVGTSAQQVAVTTASVMNSPESHAIWCEGSPHLPGVLAAHICARVRQRELPYPAANCNELTIEGLTAPYDSDDWLSDVDEKTALNNGATPLVVKKNRLVMSRFITTRSLNEDGNNDYRAREGHIPSVMHAGWVELRQQYDNVKQPNIGPDPPEGQFPPKLTTTPGMVEAVIDDWIDDLAGDTPLQGKWPGPVFDRSRSAEMKERKDVQLVTSRFSVGVFMAAVVHNMGVDTKIHELSPAY